MSEKKSANAESGNIPARNTATNRADYAEQEAAIKAAEENAAKTAKAAESGIANNGAAESGNYAEAYAAANAEAKGATRGESTPEGMITPEPQISLTLINNILMVIEQMMDDFMTDVSVDSNLSGKERRRLIGVKSRNYGFINKAWDIARDNPQFVPPNFSMADMGVNIRVFEQVRQLTIVLEQFQHLATDYLLLTSDTAYRDALRVYGSLREQSRAKVAGATALFDELQQYFTLHRGRRPGDEKPTEHELERDLRSLIHGHKDGEIIIRSETPHISGGERTVIDNVHSGKAEFKASESGEIKE